MLRYTEYPPRGYRVRVSTYWWTGRRAYLRFILRELSSIFVAWFVLETLFQINALAGGPSAYSDFEQFLRNPVVIASNVISFLFVLFHAVTWFNLSPKAMAVRLGGKRVPAALIAGPNYVAWVLISAGVAWLILRG
ncbi:MAG: fumarate reductase subunit C [Terriglobia bacterium]|nr:MAG: fumarate reductase subunit C [Terriglobia bacterium]